MKKLFGLFFDTIFFIYLFQKYISFFIFFKIILQKRIIFISVLKKEPYIFLCSHK